MKRPSTSSGKRRRRGTARERALAFGLILLAIGCGNQMATAPPPAVTHPPASPQPPATTSPSSSQTQLVVIALGDSIAAEPGQICPDCSPFVDRYADALAAETGRSVSVRNVARPGLKVAQLLRDLEGSSAVPGAVTSADAIIVAIGTSDTPWNVTDDTCDGPATSTDLVPWDEYTDECIATHVEFLKPMVDDVFTRIVELRAGAPTILRTINLYNDWIGFEGGEVPPEGVEASVAYNSTWNDMICESAAAHGFGCGDVGRAFNGADGRSASGDLLASDYIHPSDAGHERIAAVLAELGFAPLSD